MLNFELMFIVLAFVSLFGFTWKCFACGGKKNVVGPELLNCYLIVVVMSIWNAKRLEMRHLGQCIVAVWMGNWQCFGWHSFQLQRSVVPHKNDQKPCLDSLLFNPMSSERMIRPAVKRRFETKDVPTPFNSTG